MPELPEVETTRRGLQRHLVGRKIAEVVVRERRLRWPVPGELAEQLPGRRVLGVGRRAKYLLVHFENGTVIAHLGMSGSLRIVDAGSPHDVHEHLDLVLDDGRCLRFKDPRRFGCFLWWTGPPELHSLLKNLGPEPLPERPSRNLSSPQVVRDCDEGLQPCPAKAGARDPGAGIRFSGAYLFEKSRGRSVAIKNFLMNSRVVVGVGNIYANEALFGACIHPSRAAGKVSRARYEDLARAIQEVLRAAIKKGGTTLRDFVNGTGEPGYFSTHLSVYDREGQICPRCSARIRARRLGQRSTYWCPRCQR